MSQQSVSGSSCSGGHLVLPGRREFLQVGSLAGLGLSLGSTALIAPGAALVNLLGDCDGPSAPDISGAASVAGAHVHLYGKADVRVRRKMGHVTALGASPQDALDTARLAAGIVRL